VSGPTIDLTREWLTPATLADYSDDGRRLATVSADRRVVKLWDPDAGRELAALGGLTHLAVAVDCGRDGSRVAATGMNGAAPRLSREIRVWDTSTGQTLAEFHPSAGPDRFIHGVVALSPSGDRVAYDDYTRDPAAGAPERPHAVVRVCALPGGRELLRLPVADATVFSITFSPDVRMIAAADLGYSHGGGVMIWHTETGSARRQVSAKSPVQQLAFSPDGRRLAGVDREKLQIWDVRLAQELLSLRIAARRSYDGGFNPTLAWSSDGSLLASSNWDGSVSLWDGKADPSSPADRWREARSREFAWHLREADAAFGDKDRAAADFHLGRLRGADPPDESARRDHDRLRAKLGE
jgi:WD40 repeat protein